jgi:hypothetical protein
MRKLAGVLVVAALLALVWFGVRRGVNHHAWNAAADYEAAQHAAKEAGLELDFKRALPTAPPEQNAGPDYRAFVAWARSADKAEREAYGIAAGGRIGSRLVSDEEASQAIVAIRPALEIADRALSKPMCAFERDWSDPVGTLLPEYADMKQLAKVLAMEAKLHAKAGRRDATLRALTGIRRISDHADDEPIRIAALVSVAIRAIADQTLLEVIELRPQWAGDPAFAALTEATPRDLRAGLPGEVAFAQSVDFGDAQLMRHFTSEGQPQEGETPMPKLDDFTYRLVDRDALRKGVTARLLRFYTRFHAAADPKHDLPTRFKAIRDLETQLQAQAKKEGLVGKRVELFAPTMSGWVQSVGREQARAAMMPAILEIVAKMGPRPRFDVRPPTMPTDPWTGLPCLFEATAGEGFRFRSFGPNGVDDMGQGDDVEVSFPTSFKRPKQPMSGSPTA